MPICKHLKPLAECAECRPNLTDATIARIRAGLVDAGKRLGVRVVVPELPAPPAVKKPVAQKVIEKPKAKAKKAKSK